MKGRKGEDEPRLLLFLFVTVALGGLIAAIVVMVVGASTSTSRAVLADQNSEGVYSPNVVQGFVSIIGARYIHEDNESCLGTSSFTDNVLLTLLLHTDRVPQSCSFFVNGVLLSTENRLEPDCGLQCPFTDYNRQFSLGVFDFRDSHVIRVCCDGICIDRTLDPLC